MRYSPFVIFLVGCQGIFGNGGQTGEDTSHCAAVNTTVLQGDEASALGFTGNDVLAYSNGAHSGTLTYVDGSTTGIGVDVSDPGEIRFEDMEWVDDSGNPGEVTEDIGCSDVVSIDATVGLHTDDGAFAESFATTLSSALGDSASFWLDLDPSALNGSFDLADYHDLSDYDDVAAFVSGSFDSSGSHGTISGQGSGVDANDTGVAFAEELGVGSW